MDWKTHIHKEDIPSNLSFGPCLSLDCEMMGLDFRRDRLCICQIHDPSSKDVHIIQFEGTNYDAPNLKKVLADQNIHFLGHMIRLDLQFLGYYLQVIPENVLCTRTASRIIRTFGASHDLDVLLKECLDVHLSKSQTCTDWGGRLNKDQIAYACKDVVYLKALHDKLASAIEREDRMNLYRQAMKMLPSRVVLDIGGWKDEDILDFPF